MNDDHFFLQLVDAPAYPYYHKGTLEAALKSREERGLTAGYYQTLANTRDALRKKFLPEKHFDIHTPIRYDKAVFPYMAAKYNWDVPGSMAIKSMYANSAGIEGERIPECRINKPMNVGDIYQRTFGRNVFSIGDEGLNNAMIQFLDNLFPDKSKYEL